MTSREALERQKVHHYECIRVINTQLNALAPVSRIPPEVLSEIFLHTAERVAALGSSPPRVRDWIRVTHVCRHWRETALQCTALWSRVDVPALPERLSEFLSRSKDAPLSMVLSFRPLRQPGTRQFVSSEDAVLLALSALHRVQTLVVDASGDPTKAVLQRLGGRAPLLESLTITGVSNYSELDKFRGSISPMLSHPESRRLRALKTHIRCLTWSKISCDGLTRLEVFGNSDPGESIPSFLKALARMSCLEELVLREVFVARFRSPRGRSTETISALLDPITLPRLRRLQTHGESTRNAATLLNNLHTPSLSHLCVDVAQGRLEEEHLRLFAAMAQKASTLGQFTTIAFSLHTLHETSIRTYRDVCHRTTNPKEDSTWEWLQQHTPTLEYHGREEVDDIPLAGFCRLFPVGDAQALLLGYSFPAQDEWLDIARSMEAVTELRLHSTANNVVSPGKQLSLKQKDTGGGHTPFVLPNLRAFTMDSVHFWADFPRGRDMQQERETRIVAELRACLAQRAQEGAEIDTLRILGARKLWKEDLERLRAVVPCLESDGKLQSSSRDSSTHTFDGREVIFIDDYVEAGWSDEEDEEEEYEGSDVEYGADGYFY